jgi:hypothetical protein
VEAGQGAGWLGGQAGGPPTSLDFGRGDTGCREHLSALPLIQRSQPIQLKSIGRSVCVDVLIGAMGSRRMHRHLHEGLAHSRQFYVNLGRRLSHAHFFCSEM